MPGKRILSSVTTLALCASFMLPMNIFAAASFTGGTNVSGGLNTPISITDLQVTGVGNGDTVPVFLYVPAGSLSMTTTTGINFTGSSSGQRLYFSGTLTDINAALSTLKYTYGSAGTFTLEASIIGSGQIYDPSTQHIYEVVNNGSTLSASTARTLALARSINGVSGYLANITSSEENSFISNRLTQDGWFGASDAAVEGDWVWLDGPEAGTLFWRGTGGGTAFGYENWAGGEPNQSGEEDCSQFYANGSGWNDLPCTGGSLSYYVVEYGAPGNLPNIASDTLDITLSADTVTQTPTLSSPTSSSTQNTLQLTYSLPEVPSPGTVTISFNNGITTTVLTMSNSQSVNTNLNLSSLISTSGVTATSASSLADGTYTVTLSYQDSLGNPASTAVASNVVIDTTPPRITNISSDKANSAYTVGEVIDIDIAFSEIITSTGNITVTLETGNTDRSCVFSATSTTTGTCEYTVQTGDHSGDLTVSSITGTITDAVNNAMNNFTPVTNLDSNKSIVIDAVPPVISNISSHTLYPPGSTITWTTDEGATSQIEYGMTDTYGSLTSVDTALVTSHSMNILSLAAGSVYHYRIITKDALGNTTISADNTFITNVVNGGGSGSGSSPSVQYGCRDAKATNYVTYGISKPSLCKYPAETIAPIQKPVTENKTENISQNNSNTPTPSTPHVLSCSVGKFLTKPIHRAFKNDPEDVKLLEKFLNTYENAHLPIDGVYSKADFDAVVRWQEKYRDEILAPWGLKKGTGYIFRTSLAKIKEIEEGACKKN